MTRTEILPSAGYLSLERNLEIKNKIPGISTIKAIKEEELCHGVHVMAVGKESIVPEILEAAGI